MGANLGADGEAGALGAFCVEKGDGVVIKLLRYFDGLENEGLRSLRLTELGRMEEFLECETTELPLPCLEYDIRILII